MLGSVWTAISHACTADWLLLTTGVLLLLYIAGTWNYDYFQRQCVASTKPKLPFCGDVMLPFLGFRPAADTFRELYERGEGHGVFGLFEFTKPTFMIRDLETLKVVLVKEFENFMNHRSIQSEKIDPFFSRNLLNLKDQEWKDMRATLSPAFTSSKIKGMFPFISQCGDQMVQHLSQKYANNPEGGTMEPLEIDLKDLFARLATDVIASTAFGVTCDSLKDPHNEFYRMGKLLTTFTSSRAFKFLGFMVVPKLMEMLGARVFNTKATNFFDSLVHETIRERQKKGIFRPDMLQLLMQVQEGALRTENEDSAEEEVTGAEKTKLKNDDITAQAVIFFFAGFETISNALSFASILLSRHRDIQRRLQEEIDEMMARTGGKPTYEAVQNMKYLQIVLYETLRMFPTVIKTDRVCKKDTVLPASDTSGPVAVRKGNAIAISIIGLHYDPRYWEDPGKFDPQRFTGSKGYNIRPCTYMPFGGGPRVCIGHRFAFLETKVALVHLLSRFDLHPCDKTKYPITFDTGINLMARGGMWCGLVPRNK